MEATAKKNTVKYIFMIIAILIIIINIFPLIWLTLSGFKTKADFLSYEFRFFPSIWTADNYVGLLTNNMTSVYFPRFASLSMSMFMTALVAVTALICSLYLNSTAAYVFARLRFKGQKILWVYYAFTMFVPNMAIMIPCYRICSSLQIMNTFFVLIMPGVVYVWSIFFYRQFYLSVPKSLEEAARVDGCGRIGIYFKIFLPMSATPFVIMGISVFQGFWNSYIWPIMTIDSPYLMQINQLIAYFKSSYGIEWQYLIASSALASIPLVVILFVFQRFIVQGVKISGIK